MLLPFQGDNHPHDITQGVATDICTSNCTPYNIAQGIATLYPGLCSFAPTARNHRSSLHYLAHCAVRVFHDIDAFAYSLALCSANGIYCYRNNIANADSLN